MTNNDITTLDVNTTDIDLIHERRRLQIEIYTQQLVSALEGHPNAKYLIDEVRGAADAWSGDLQQLHNMTIMHREQRQLANALNQAYSDLVWALENGDLTHDKVDAFLVEAHEVLRAETEEELFDEMLAAHPEIGGMNRRTPLMVIHGVLAHLRGERIRETWQDDVEQALELLASKVKER